MIKRVLYLECRLCKNHHFPINGSLMQASFLKGSSCAVFACQQSVAQIQLVRNAIKMGIRTLNPIMEEEPLTEMLAIQTSFSCGPHLVWMDPFLEHLRAFCIV